jgi:hypothetical protein
VLKPCDIELVIKSEAIYNSGHMTTELAEASFNEWLFGFCCSFINFHTTSNKNAAKRHKVCQFQKDDF